AQPLHRRAQGGPPAAVEGQPPPEPPLRRPGHEPATALPLHRQRPRVGDARLRLLGRESAPGTVRAGGHPGGNRLPQAFMRSVVVGGGAWGTAFAKLLRERGHDVFLAVRATLDDAPYEEADLVVLAVPSSSFREVLGRVKGR